MISDEPHGSERFEDSYYVSNRQDNDRPALLYYTRLARIYFKSGRVLDFGCGTGFFVRRLSRFFPTDGYEVSSHGAKKTRWVSGCRVFERLGDIPQSTYVGITALHVLEHIPDPELVEVLKVWQTVLQPEGAVLCVVPERHGLAHRIKGDDWVGFKDPTHVNLKSRDEWICIFKEQGFDVVNIGTDGLWDFPYSPDMPRMLDAAIYGTYTAIQFLAGRLLLSAGSGESLVAVLKKVKK